MLPGIWLIVATFVFSFLAVFAGLRLITTTHLAKEQLATLPSPAVSAPDTQQARLGIPVMFDLRFAVDATPVAAVPTTLTLHAIDRAAHAEPPAAVPPPATPSDWPPAPTMPAEPQPEDAPAPAAAADDAAAPVQKIDIAALPEPTATPAEPPPATAATPDANVAAVEPLDRGPPPKVENAGTSQPAVKRPRRAKKKVAKPKAQAAASQAADPFAAVFTPAKD